MNPSAARIVYPLIVALVLIGLWQGLVVAFEIPAFLVPSPARVAQTLVADAGLLFGALDEITRNRLDSDLLDLWQANGLTVIFVTHSITEAVYLSNRVIVMAARPGRIVEEVLIDEPYPRTADFRVSQRFANYAKHLQDSLLRASGAQEDEALA